MFSDFLGKTTWSKKAKSEPGTTKGHPEDEEMAAIEGTLHSEAGSQYSHLSWANLN